MIFRYVLATPRCDLSLRVVSLEPNLWCSRLEMKKVEANPYTTSYNLDPQEYTIPLSLCVYVGEKGPDWQIVSLNKMAFFSGRRHLRSKALVMAAAANNHSQPQVFRFVKMRNPPKFLKIFHLCRNQCRMRFHNLETQFVRHLESWDAATTNRYSSGQNSVRRCLPSAKTKKESSCDNKQLYNWGKKSQRSEPLYWCILEVLFPGVRTNSFP